MPVYENRYYYLGPWVVKNDADLGNYYDAPERTVGRIDMRPVHGVTEAYGFFSTDQQLTGSNYIYLGDDLYGDLTGLQISAWKSALGLPQVNGVSLIDVLWDTLTAHADPEGGIRTLPIMPTHLGVMELHLGGHSLIRRSRWKGEADPAWKPVQKVLQDNYRSLAKSNPKDGDLPAKVLGAWKKKYKVSDEGLFIPAGEQKVKAKPPTTEITDDFNRTDESLSNGPWDAVDGVWSIVSNQVNCAGDGANFPASARHTSSLSSDDHYAQVLDASVDGNRFIGAAARFSSSAETYYFQLERDNSGLRRVGKVVAGTETILGSDSSGANGRTVKISCDGSTITGYSNSAQIFSVTDTAITGNLQTGLVAHSFGNGYGDNFLAEDLVASQLPINLTGNLSLRSGVLAKKVSYHRSVGGSI